MARKEKNCLVSIIFVYFNTPLEIEKALSSIKNSIGEYSYEIIIVNNCSSKFLPEEVNNLPKVTVINNKENLGYGKALNQGAEVAKGKYLLLSNSDLIFLKDSLALMIKKLDSDSSVGTIGPQFLDDKQKVQLVGSNMPFLPRALFAFSFFNRLFPNNYFSKQYYLLDFDRKTEKEISALCGACLMFRKDIFEQIEGFDERFFMYFEEADICYRVNKAGFIVLYYPLAKVIHYIGRSSSDKVWIRNQFEKSRYKFFKKYHNIALALMGEGILRFSSYIGGLL